jgi:hypothetical protein
VDDKRFVIDTRRTVLVGGADKCTTIDVPPQTKEALELMMHPGQSYDRLIKEGKGAKREDRVMLVNREVAKYDRQ